MTVDHRDGVINEIKRTWKKEFQEGPLKLEAIVKRRIQERRRWNLIKVNIKITNISRKFKRILFQWLQCRNLVVLNLKCLLINENYVIT